MQSDTLEDQYVIKLAKNATETYGMLQTAFGPSCMNRASVFEWHKRFKKAQHQLTGIYLKEQAEYVQNQIDKIRDSVEDRQSRIAWQTINES